MISFHAPNITRPLMEKVKAQYERFPYPQVPFLASVPSDQLWQINARWLLRRCGLPDVTKPSLWIAGCGTFQPYLFGNANPNASILATDISSHSLRLARRRCHFRGLRGITFREMDLDYEGSYPHETFDFIECFGVLMSLLDPGLALKRMAARLKPNGVLRIMVYPHYGRQRVFHIQRLAKLLGLTVDVPGSPQQLKKLLCSLPPSHPLRVTFLNYQDAKNNGGIVDGFLHASDQAFTGIRICQLIEEAGLDLAFAMHRPWGQPRERAAELGLIDHDPALWLHYLDMWQELRSNFILCLVKKESTNKVSNGVFRHPVFSSGVRSLGVRQWLRLVRLGFVGGEFQSRTHQHNLRLTSQQVREVKRGQAMSKSGGEILLPQIPPRLGAGLVTTSPRITPSFSWAPRKDGVLNPLYHHLIDPLIFRERWLSELGEDFPSLSEQLVRWETHSRPLENKNCPFGLTPLGTYRFAPELMLLARRDILENEVSSFSDLSLLHEGEKIDQLRKRLGNFEKKKFTPAEWRELWCLLDGAQNIELDR